VHPRCQTLMHYFSCLGEPSVGHTISMTGYIMPNLCLCIQCDQQATLCVLVLAGYEMSIYYFSCPGGLGADQSNLCFASGVIYGSHSVFWCFSGTKHRTSIFHAWEGPVQVPSKVCRNTLAELMIFHPVCCGSHSVF
jgi:hypothetical protein